MSQLQISRAIVETIILEVYIQNKDNFALNYNDIVSKDIIESFVLKSDNNTTRFNNNFDKLCEKLNVNFTFNKVFLKKYLSEYMYNTLIENELIKKINCRNPVPKIKLDIDTINTINIIITTLLSAEIIELSKCIDNLYGIYMARHLDRESAEVYFMFVFLVTIVSNKLVEENKMEEMKIFIERTTKYFNDTLYLKIINEVNNKKNKNMLEAELIKMVAITSVIIFGIVIMRNV